MEGRHKLGMTDKITKGRKGKGFNRSKREGDTPGRN
jgi:hypothetical protein